MNVAISPLDDLEQRGWRIEPSGETVELTAGVWAPVVVHAAGPLGGVPDGVVDGKGEGFRLELEARYDAERGSYLLRRFEIIAPDGDEVTGLLLRGIAPLRVMRWVLPRSWYVLPRRTEPSPGTPTTYAFRFMAPEQERDDGLAATIEDAAMVYRLAEIVREPAAKAVAETLGLQTRTATNWIARAREKGLL